MTVTKNQWDEPPSDSNFDFFLARLADHSQVSSCEAIDKQRYRIQRARGAEFVVLLTDVYVFGESDYVAMHARFPDVTHVVTVSAYSGFTKQAESAAATDGLVLCDVKGFMSMLQR